jgi:hypothetical protein
MKKMDPKMAKMMAANMGRPMQPPVQAGPAGAGVPAMMKKGGKVGQLSKANGVASKGKTKGTMIKMAGSDKGMKKGGKC